jgi:hypothetical protein
VTPDRARMVRQVLRLQDETTTRELMEKWIRCMARGTATDDDVAAVIAAVERASEVRS